MEEQNTKPKKLPKMQSIPMDKEKVKEESQINKEYLDSLPPKERYNAYQAYCRWRDEQRYKDHKEKHNEKTKTIRLQNKEYYTRLKKESIQRIKEGTAQKRPRRPIQTLQDLREFQRMRTKYQKLQKKRMTP